MKKWCAQDAILQNDFDFIEPVLSTRCALLDVLERRHSAGGVSRQLMTQLERFAVCAREGGRHQVAEGLLQRLRQLEVQADVTCWSWRAEEARVQETLELDGPEKEHLPALLPGSLRDPVWLHRHNEKPMRNLSGSAIRALVLP